MSLPPFARRLLAASALAAVAAAPAQAELIVGLTSTNGLVLFDSASPTNGTVPLGITGLATSEQLLGIDFRPANGTFIALSSQSKLYTVNVSTGAATLLSTLSTPLAGASFGVDFNPTVDRLRVVSNSGQNLRINVDTGAVTVDTALNGAVSGASGAGYTNSFAGATSTTLYDINSSTDSLYIQAPPNAGTMTLVGSLGGIDIVGVAGFDISGSTGMAYAALLNGDTGDSSLYTINLATGAATAVGIFGYGGNTAISAPLIGITAVPEPGTYALFAAGLLGVGMLARRRRQD